jgi:hypothetical protein
MQSMSAIGNSASWAMVLYDNSQASEWSEPRKLARHLQVELEVRTGRRSSFARTILGRKFYPKLQFWLQATDLVRRHEYVFTADEDISFVGFDLTNYRRRAQVAFKRGPPLLSQPVIVAQSTKASNDSRGKWEQFFNTAGFWQGTRIVAAEVSFVEQQVTMISSSFFLSTQQRWETLAAAQQQHGSDFGLDSSWCGAAALYAPSRVACAIVPLPIIHEDTRSLNWTEDTTFWNHSMRLMSRVRKHLLPDDWKSSVKLAGEFRRREVAGITKDNIAARQAALKTCIQWSTGLYMRNTCADNDPSASNRTRPKHLYRTMGKVPCQTARMDCFPKCHTHFNEIAWCAPRSSTGGRQYRSSAGKTRG